MQKAKARKAKTHDVMSDFLSIECPTEKAVQAQPKEKRIEKMYLKIRLAINRKTKRNNIPIPINKPIAGCNLNWFTL